jgi:hypothetical protein
MVSAQDIGNEAGQARRNEESKGRHRPEDYANIIMRRFGDLGKDYDPAKASKWRLTINRNERAETQAFQTDGKEEGLNRVEVGAEYRLVQNGLHALVLVATTAR